MDAYSLDENRPLPGFLLRQLRILAGLTASDLAQGAGISRSMVYQVESGQRKPSIGTLEIILSCVGAGIKTGNDIRNAYGYASIETPVDVQWNQVLEALDKLYHNFYSQEYEAEHEQYDLLRDLMEAYDRWLG